MKIDDSNTTIIMAASLADRTGQLISDGWVKGAFATGHEMVEKFCIHGAISLAIEEMFSTRATSDMMAKDIEDIVVAIIVDEAKTRHGYNPTPGHSIQAAAFNDAAKTTHEDVLGVIRATSQRLWNMALEDQSQAPISWAPVEDEAAHQYLYATIGN